MSALRRQLISIVYGNGKSINLTNSVVKTFDLTAGQVSRCNSMSMTQPFIPRGARTAGRQERFVSLFVGVGVGVRQVIVRDQATG